MSEQRPDALDTQGYNHCGACGARADVVEYLTYYKVVECSDCGEQTTIPKRCATEFDRFKAFLDGERDVWHLGGTDADA